MPNKITVNDLPELFAPDLERIHLAKERQTRFWKGEPNHVPPIVCPGTLRPEQEAIPAPNFKEAFDDIDMMIFGQVRAAFAMANSGSNGVPSVRGNYGTGVLLSCLGLEQEVFPDKMPWLKQHLTREQAAKLTPDDIKIQGTFARGLEFMQQIKDLFGDTLPAYCMDTQGPFDLAHLMIGDDLFYLFYDDAKLGEHVMNLAVELGIKTHEWMKEINGEAPDQFYHGNALYAENIGIRICEDTSAIVGPDMIEDICMPATRRLAKHFGGAWVHYCGRNDHLTRAVCEAPELIGINFGHIPGHEQDHPFRHDMEVCRENSTKYFGDWPKLPGESAKDQLKRLHHWAKLGVLLPQAYPDGDEFKNHEELLEFWYGL
jgi:hypothetical protein